MLLVTFTVSFSIHFSVLLWQVLGLPISPFTVSSSMILLSTIALIQGLVYFSPLFIC